MDGFTYKLDDRAVTPGCSAGFSVSCRDVCLTSGAANEGVLLSSGLTGGAAGVGFDVPVPGLTYEVDDDAVTPGCSAGFGGGCKEVIFTLGTAGAGFHASAGTAGGGGGKGAVEPVVGLTYNLDDDLAAALSDRSSASLLESPVWRRVERRLALGIAGGGAQPSASA